jgi:hypothetical protein
MQFSYLLNNLKVLILSKIIKEFQSKIFSNKIKIIKLLQENLILIKYVKKMLFFIYIYTLYF